MTKLKPVPGQRRAGRAVIITTPRNQLARMKVICATLASLIARLKDEDPANVSINPSLKKIHTTTRGNGLKRTRLSSIACVSVFLFSALWQKHFLR